MQTLRGNMRDRLEHFARQDLQDAWGSWTNQFVFNTELQGEVKWLQPDQRTLQQAEDMRQAARILIRASYSVGYKDLIRVWMQDGTKCWLEILAIQNPVHGKRLFQILTGRTPSADPEQLLATTGALAWTVPIQLFGAGG